LARSAEGTGKMAEDFDQFSVLTRVGHGTPMGNLFRRFWLPALLTREVQERDGTPVRIRILSEDLLAFRDSNGLVGIVSAYCSHKLAPLFFGRNEKCGLRCVYHGWKFNVDGDCVDIPNIIPPDNFEALKEKARIVSYPTKEAGGIVWVYMGPAALKPDLPDFEWLELPADQTHVSRWHHSGNWLAGLEGEIDTSHISFLHTVLNVPEDGPDRLRLASDGAPQITIRETDYGYYYGARRKFGDQYYWRVTQWMFPTWSAIPSAISDFTGNGRVWVPIDDNLTVAFGYRYRLDRPFTKPELEEVESGALFPPRTVRGATQLPHGYVIDTFLPLANRGNDFLIDRQAQRSDTFTGIWGVNELDRALPEWRPTFPGYPGIVDRRGEHLVRADLPAITARRILTKMARDLERGIEPTAALNGASYRVRSIAQLSPIEDFDELMSVHASEQAAASTHQDEQQPLSQ
jgi:phenylpropionate dioxygenase-like ring-hydroxylating dioxygenase large terminal subunit